MDDPAFDIAMGAAFDAAFSGLTFDAMIVVALIRNGALAIEDVVGAIEAQKAVIDLTPDDQCGLRTAALEARANELRARLRAASHTLPQIPGLSDR